MVTNGSRSPNSATTSSWRATHRGDLSAKRYASRKVPLLCPRSLLHRGIFQDRRALLPVEKFTDKGPTDIVLINGPKRSRNETPQQRKKPWGVRVTRNDAGAKNCQTFKSEAP